MILSVSRRTDVPNYYSDWFFNRIKEGFVYVRNPMNAHRISEISLSPEAVDCIVFWTKNPKPMLDRLDELKEYPYYFQFTLTGYGRDMEYNVPHKKKEMLPVFKELSEKIGKNRVILRYDPIIFTDRYTPEYHLNAFGQIANALNGYTERCVISFVDTYAKNKRSLEALHAYEPEAETLADFARKLGKIAADNGMEIGSCAEAMDLEQYGIRHNRCIDPKLIESLIGCRVMGTKDQNQRKECGCMESIDIGAYNTCLNGCKYCYANGSPKIIESNYSQYDSTSPLLCGKVEDGDRIVKRTVKSLKEGQLRFLDE